MPKEGLEPPFLTEPRSKRGVSAISPFGHGGESENSTLDFAVQMRRFSTKLIPQFNKESFTRDDSGKISTIVKSAPSTR